VTGVVVNIGGAGGKVRDACVPTKYTRRVYPRNTYTCAHNWVFICVPPSRTMSENNTFIVNPYGPVEAKSKER
jgi:hypothetical protein